MEKSLWGKHLSALLVLMALAVGAEPANPFGATAHVSRDEFVIREREFELCHAMGMGQMRFDYQMRDIKPTKDSRWDFSRYDPIVDSAEKFGVTMLPVVFDPPAWAIPIWEHADDYAEFVRVTVERYGTRMPVLEIWNEQNIPSFWPPEPNVTNYLKVLRAAYRAAKAANPSVKVMFGGLAGTDLGYIGKAYDYGAKDFFDIMNVHPYSDPLPPEGQLDVSLEKLRALMAKYRDENKPVWITEHGWPTHRAGIGSGAGNFILAGLKAARPEKKTWNVVCAACLPDSEKPDPAFAAGLQELLPLGSHVEVCNPRLTNERLAAGGVDAVVYPTDEWYPAETAAAVAEFVKKGGTLVDVGGMPAWIRYRVNADGDVSCANNWYDSPDLKALRIGVDAWWLGPKSAPQVLTVYATPAGLAAGLKQSPTGFKVVHFANDRLLQPGDKMIPLVEGKCQADGKTYVAACLYEFDSDYKGRVVVSTVKFRDKLGSNDETRQALLITRALGISFAEGVEKYFLYEFRAPERDPWYSEEHFGMVHRNLTPKPAWGAFMNFIQHHPVGSKRLENVWHDEKRMVYWPQWTRPDGTAAGMIWTKDKVRSATLVFDKPSVKFADVWGKAIYPTKTGERSWRIELSGSPVYFEEARLVRNESTF